MEIAFQTSRTGAPTCAVGERRLHSAYSPEAEGERFLVKAMGDRRPGYFVLIGPCLDYLSPAIRREFPGAVIISIQLDAAFRGREIGEADHIRYPDDPVGLEVFLNEHVTEDCLTGIQVLEWPPAAAAYPAEARAASEFVRRALDRLSSSAATLRAFGRRWILNACRNYLLLERSLYLRIDGRPIVVAAAGPSLEEALSILGPRTGLFRLFAVSSALSACRASGLEPELVAATDGGFWSRYHLQTLADRSCPVAAPLTALPSSSLSRGMASIILDQGNFPEPELCRLLGCGIRIPSHGTVTGAALHLASRATSGPIIAAGMDLAAHDLRSHVRPHGFDFLCRDGQSRLEPFETLLYGRETPMLTERVGCGPWRRSRSLAVYADALAHEAVAPRFAGRLYRLLPSPVGLDGYSTLDRGELEALLPTGVEQDGAPAPRLRVLPPPEIRAVALKAALEDWIRAIREACRDLSRGLLPASERTIELLRAADLADWTAARRACRAGRDAGAAAVQLEERCAGFLEDIEARLF
jgi:hypothetical protein